MKTLIYSSENQKQNTNRIFGVLLIKLIFFFLLVCYPIYSLQAQTDIAKIISGTYKCSGHIGTFGKSDVDKDRVTVRIRKTGEKKVSVSMDGVSSTYELTIEQGGPAFISGTSIIKGLRASLALELDHKPATIRGGNANEAPTQENKEVWWFDGTANEDKPESLAENEKKDEIKDRQPEESQDAPVPPEKKPEPDKITTNPTPSRSPELDPEAVMTGHHIYTLDEQKRPIRAEGWLYEEQGVRNKSAQKSVSGSFNKKFDPALQKKVPKVLNPVIHASHVIAKRFGGSGDKYNLIPTLAEINLITIGKFEDKIGEQMESGQRVYLQVYISYSYTGNIPSSIVYKAYKSDGKKLVEFDSLDIKPTFLN